jgi:hypothetical protein
MSISISETVKNGREENRQWYVGSASVDLIKEDEFGGFTDLVCFVEYENEEEKTGKHFVYVVYRVFLLGKKYALSQDNEFCLKADSNHREGLVSLLKSVAVG